MARRGELGLEKVHACHEKEVRQEGDMKQKITEVDNMCHLTRLDILTDSKRRPIRSPVRLHCYRDTDSTLRRH